MNSNCSYVARNLYVDNAILNQVKAANTTLIVIELETITSLNWLS